MCAALPQCGPSTASSIEFLVADFCFVFFVFFLSCLWEKKILQHQIHLVLTSKLHRPEFLFRKYSRNSSSKMNRLFIYYNFSSPCLLLVTVMGCFLLEQVSTSADSRSRQGAPLTLAHSTKCIFLLRLILQSCCSMRQMLPRAECTTQNGCSPTL